MSLPHTVRAGVVACPDCDLLQSCPTPPYGGATLCGRCEAVLIPRRRDSFDTTLALALAAGIMLALANAFPIVTLNVQAQQVTTTLPDTVAVLWQYDMPILAAVVAFTTILAPALEACLAIYVLLHLRTAPVASRRPAYALRMFRSVEIWSMTEVFMLGALVALVKLEDYAQLRYGLALWCLAAAMVLLAAMGASFNHAAAWERLRPQPA